MEQSVFESKSIAKAYFTLSIPVVFSMIITIVYNVTDTYFIALTGDTNLVAGISLCAPAFTLLMGFGNIFGQGGSSVVSRLIGQQDRENLRRVSSFCFYGALLFGVAAAVFMVAFRVLLLQLLGADDQTLPFALPYFFWFSVGAPAVLLSFIHTNLLRAEGMAKESMIGTVGGSVVNIILDPALIFGLKLGAAGAAIATVLGYLFTDLYCLYIVKKKSKTLATDFHCCVAEKEHIVQVFGVGTSAALQNLTQSFCLILTNQNLLVYGNDKVAAMGIVQKLSMIVMLIVVGFSFGGAPLIGYTYGSGNRQRLRELLRFVLRFLCLLSLVLTVLICIAAPWLIRFFLTDEALVQAAVLMLRAQVVSMVLMAVVLFVTIWFQATGKALPALCLSLTRQGVVFALVLLVAVRLAGYNGVVFAQCISDALSALIAVFLLFATSRKEIGSVVLK